MNRVLLIRDTRQWDWKRQCPVRGSGESRPCDHCQAPCEIHVTILLDGRTLVVGSTCAVKLLGRTAQLSSLGLRRSMLQAELNRLGDEFALKIEAHDDDEAWLQAVRLAEQSPVGLALWNPLRSRIMAAWRGLRDVRRANAR